MASPLLSLNNLIHLQSGVFASSEHAAGVSYSDGDAEEEYIYRAVSSVEDLSSLSEELRDYERDWASECHLSSKRANVFRALDFNGIDKILEIGSGCGAITRFLGELGGAVDAVEGSLRRAEITRIRCRDLDNVSVIHADFNALDLPDEHYDLALLTGVLEYAGKYGKADESPADAAVSMLQRILDCLGPDGKLIVAIENRIGFKYLAGASEDHFSRPWVGVCKYPECDDPLYKEKQGIETWDRGQWKEMLKQLSNISSQWYYPFPDYKLATSLLSESFIQNDSFASTCLTRIQSRDYTALWHPLIDEQLFWQTAGSARMLEEMANSFVLVLQKNQGLAGGFIPFDFVHFSGQTRKPVYRIMVQKKKDSPQVEKKRLFGQLTLPDQDIITQHLTTEPYHEGELLITHWLRSMRSCTSSGTLDNLLKPYYSYLLNACKTADPQDLLDLLPMNIVVLKDGSWVYFDQEWYARESISPSFILFRTVLYFYWDNKEILQPFCKKQSLKTGWQFVEYCLGRVLYSNEIDIPSFVQLENAIQRAISRSGAFAPIEHLLDSSPESVTQRWSWKKCFLVWGATAEVTRPFTARETELGSSIVFTLPAEVCSSSFIQFHVNLPDQDVGSVFALHSFSLYGDTPNASKTCLFPEKSDHSLPQLIQLTGISFHKNIRGGVYTVDEKKTQILHFAFPENIVCTDYATLECEIKMEFLSMKADEVHKEKYKIEKQKLDVALSESTRLVDEKIGEIISRDNLIAKKTEEVIARDNLINDKIGEVNALCGQVEEQKHRLKEIEESKGWQLILKLRGIKSLLQQLIGKNSLKEQGKAKQNTTSKKFSTCLPFEADGGVVPASTEKRNKRSKLRLHSDHDEEKKLKKSDSISKRDQWPLGIEGPKISIVVAVFNTVPDMLEEALQSVFTQSYEFWEMIIIDSGSTNGATLQLLKKIKHPRVKVHCLHKTDNLTQAMDEGISLASGDWILFLGHFDRLRPDALNFMATEIVQQEDADILYWNESVIDGSGSLIDRTNKLEWNNNELPTTDSIGNTLCVRKSLILEGGGLAPVFDGAQFYEFVLRVRSHTRKIIFVKEILSETRRFEPVNAEERNRVEDLGKKAWEDAFPLPEEKDFC